MTYTLDESHTSRNFTPADQVPAVFGYPRTIDYITIHHWGANGQQFGTVRDYLCTNTTPTSAHFIVQDGEVACIVSPLDAAWHAGNARGNAQSIGIECHPEATDGDYQTIGELVAWLRAQYGDVPLVPHHYWTSTACPGDYDLNRIDAIARGTGTVTAAASTITPITPSGAFMPDLTEVEQRRILSAADKILGTIPNTAKVLDSTDGGYLVSILKNVLTKQDGGYLVGQVNGVPAAVWNQNIGSGNAAGILTHIDQKPGGASVAAALSDTDLAVLAKAVNDEADKRARTRLGQ